MNTQFKKVFLDKSTETLRAMAHPIRMAIIDLLFHNEKMTVTDIHTTLKIEQAVASHHLRILKNTKVLNVERVGKNALYKLIHSEYYQIIKILTKVI